jgi:hypothetical protein
MKQIICACCFVLLLFRSAAQNITAAEYFFDTDPGVGLGTAIPVSSPGTTVNFTASIPTGSLSPGFHVLAIRTRDAGNVWSLFESRAVYIATAAIDMPAITAAEYFVDNDPGAGNGIAINVGTTGNVVNFTVPVPTPSLATGFHILAIRVKDANGTWSLFESRPFYISANTGDAAGITAAEYFIDSDPGAGNGTPMNIGTSGNAVNFTAAIPTASLSTGFHVLAIRARNADGTWSLFETRPFYISPTTTDMGPLVGGEYFIDSDPGVGNGQPFTFSASGNNINEVVQMQIPAGTSTGDHLLVARVRDANGVWSLFDTVRTLAVSGTLPLDFLSFSARRKEAVAMAEWTTDNEVNTSHFEVERSRNGIAFEKIGQVPATNRAGQHRYSFDDATPFKGLNFYRLKQVDQNGRFKYSAIVKLFFGEKGVNELKLFPQPVQSTLTVAFGGRGHDLFVQVFDAGGKMVMNGRKQNVSTFTMETSSLSKGTYWIVVSDGITQQKGQFIKQ